MTTRQEKLAGGAWILEQLTGPEQAHGRNEARRVLGEVMRAWPGDVHRLWWKWLHEAASSLRLRTKTIDASVHEVMEMVVDGAQLITYSEQDQPQWMAVLGSKGRHYDVAVSSETTQRRRLSPRKLRHYLEGCASDGRVRCVVIQSGLPRIPAGVEGAHKDPLVRLRQLLQPEWSDIWIVLVFAFVVSLLMLATPIAVEALVNTVAFGRFIQPVVLLALILFTFLGFQGAVRALQAYVVEIIQRRLFARVSADLAYRLPRVSQEAVEGEYLPELVNRFFDVATVQKVSAQLLLDGIGLVLSTLIGMAVLGFYHPWLLGFDLLLVASIAFIILVLGRGAVTSAIKESKLKYKMAAWLEDIARCPTAFRTDGGSEFALERADRLIYHYLQARRGHYRIVLRQILFALGLQAIASTVLLGLGGWLVMSGELTMGQLVAAELIVSTIVAAFAKLGKHMESYYDLLAGVDKLGVLFDLPVERPDGMLIDADAGAVSLVLHAVSYRWPDGEVALEDVNAQVEAGSSLAIYGSSGAGKSVLLDMIYGLRMPSTGYLTIDAADPGDLRPDILRGRIGLARGSEIFHGTIEENVHLFRESITAGEVRHVLGELGLLDAIMHLEKGFDTELASGGHPLSESQCRILNLARAVVGRPGLLLIDGLLDGLADEDLSAALSFLLHSDRPWTLILATGREEIARKCAQRLNLPTHQSHTRA
ncbi:MAG: ABC transporter ATP-binding protein [Pirellulaceae bacterium]|nr:ABC transporter ATP-binding protein [Planctomycetales bacterium]